MNKIPPWKGLMSGEIGLFYEVKKEIMSKVKQLKAKTDALSLKLHHFELLTILIKTPNRTQHDFEDIIRDINGWRPLKVQIKVTI